jgi:threonine/homoserine/homoserine lactone efflux protein
LSGFVLTFGDPKAIFGYASLLPAFVDLTAVSIFDTIAIMAIAATAISVAKSFYLALGRHSVSWLANQALNSKLNAVAGSAFICAGLVVISRVCITTWL